MSYFYEIADQLNNANDTDPDTEEEIEQNEEGVVEPENIEHHIESRLIDGYRMLEFVEDEKDKEKINDEQYRQLCNFVMKVHKALPHENVKQILCYISEMLNQHTDAKKLIHDVTNALQSEFQKRVVLEKKLHGLELELKKRHLLQERVEEQRRKLSGKIQKKHSALFK